MTKKEILKYNERCALFLGYKNSIKDKDFYFIEKEYDKDSMIPKVLELNFEKKFYSDWNWIHEIIEKINNSKITVPMNGIPDSIVPYIEAKRPLNHAVRSNNKEKTVQAINNFLIWYNENKTN